MGSDSKSQWTGDRIRQSYLDFFKQRGHTIVPSASLVPGDDPTLLFTNAGMVQFKDVFLGLGSRAYTRVADSQKCMRVAGKHNDLEDVGRDGTHHTFFEMLGNWSFGDYYKQEAISWAWELLTDVWGLEKSRLYATCFEDEKGEIPRDDEAKEIWLQQPGFLSTNLLFFGRKDNFWEMAETGPCGPDSEIHYDRGPAYCNMQDVPGHVCQVNGPCERFLELWNLVFIQYNRTGPNDLEPLPAKHVDTGMGFERIVSVLQGVDSNYQTDLFTPIFARIQEKAGHTPEERQALLTPYRVIADHGRAAAFLIADGVVPGNTGRNYVCRMVVRRAARFGTQAGFTQPFLGAVAESVIETYGAMYPELKRNRKAIVQTLTEEEIRFQRTVELGVSHLEEHLDRLEDQEKRMLAGQVAFDLYATYGLPLEISRDIAKERGMDIDDAGFLEAMDLHRLASGSEKDAEDQSDLHIKLYQDLLHTLTDSHKLPAEGVQIEPYESLEIKSSLLAIVRDGELVSQAEEGDRIALIVPRTPFYVESGGQVADHGSIVSLDEPRWVVEIEDVNEPVGGLITHVGIVKHGQPAVDDVALVTVGKSRRMDIMRNHTATHLLHAALQSVLGEHARQAGSLVAPDRLRFDFTHPKALSVDELDAVERFVNEAILAGLDLKIEQASREDAIAEGAMALFGENYGEQVRTVSIGDSNRISFELCAGTHVPNTGLIGVFLILSESSVAAGIRRIEALTGRGALALIHTRDQALKQLSQKLGTGVDGLLDRVDALTAQVEAQANEIQELKARSAAEDFSCLQPENVEGVQVLTGILSNASVDTLRSLTDRFRSEHPENGVIVLGSIQDEKPMIVASLTQDLAGRGLHAGALVKHVAQAVGGGGGGKPTLAQAGGKDARKLPEALALVVPWVREQLK